MSKMTKNTLRLIHGIISTRGKQMNYIGNIPKISELHSLNLRTPTTEQLRSDYLKISTHFKHPIFQDFIPTHSEMVESFHLSWLKRV